MLYNDRLMNRNALHSSSDSYFPRLATNKKKLQTNKTVFSMRNNVIAIRNTKLDLGTGKD